jgi:hypothetical protein
LAWILRVLGGSLNLEHNEKRPAHRVPGIALRRDHRFSEVKSSIKI